jgi:glycosyltransferase involved in cell wall biosynthesis
MLGALPGHISSQAETVASLLEREGFPVKLVSRRLNRWVRGADIVVRTLVRTPWTDIQMLQVFGGRSFPLEDMASAIAKATGTPIVMTLHGGNLPTFASMHPSWTKRVFQRARVITVPSAYLARELAWLELPLKIIPNTIDISEYPFMKRDRARPRILWMRAFHDVYDPILAVRAFARIRAIHSDALMTMAGPDLGLLEDTRKEARRLRVSSRVYFSGVLDEAAKRAAARQHDIYLVTNNIDNMPVSVLEMGAMGLPVVATNVGGMPDLCTDGVNALLVEYGDERALAEAVIKLVETPELVSVLSREARELALKSAWPNVRLKWLSLLRDLFPEYDAHRLGEGIGSS